MDYLNSSRVFQLRKVARYARIYGIRRTYVKVMGQLHMRKRFEPIPEPTGMQGDARVVGIIGCGNYAFSNIAYYLKRECGHVIRSCMDIDIHRAVSMSRYYGIPMFTSRADDLIGDPKVRLIYIASNHASHAEYAIEALRAGKSVYIEKPHVVSEEQLSRLAAAMENSRGKVFLGFNRPGSPFGRVIGEQLGRAEGPGMYNWFVAGHAIDPDHWYFRPEEGGRILGNLCHWTDFVLRLVPAGTYPIRINPTRAAKADSDIAVTYTFGDGSIAVISFSAKGHTFEGVRETFNAHKGNCLITMEDFRTMTIDVLHRKTTYRLFFRNHGHEANITNAYRSVVQGLPRDDAAFRKHVVETGLLFLKTKEALETKASITICGEDLKLHSKAEG